MSQPLIYIKENNTFKALPNPTKYNVPNSDLDSSDTTRTEEGVLVRNRIRQGVNRVELSWTASSSVIAQIAPLVIPEKVEVRFFNPHKALYEEAELYVGDRTCNLSVYLENMSPAESIWEYSFNLIEY